VFKDVGDRRAVGIQEGLHGSAGSCGPCEPQGPAVGGSRFSSEGGAQSRWPAFIRRRCPLCAQPCSDVQKETIAAWKNTRAVKPSTKQKAWGKGEQAAIVNTGDAAPDKMNVPLGPYLSPDSGWYQMLQRKLQKQSSQHMWASVR